MPILPILSFTGKLEYKSDLLNIASFEGLLKFASQCTVILPRVNNVSLTLHFPYAFHHYIEYLYLILKIESRLAYAINGMFDMRRQSKIF